MASTDELPMFTDPAVIVAISCCWLYRRKQSPSRVVGIEVFSRHPTTCQFCDYPTDVLMDYIEDFHGWVAEGSMEAGRTMVAWSRTDRAAQHGRVLKAGIVAEIAS